jgi:L-alanine-DL-glutamate epimerase-like enolase superfamily enzyme
MGVSSQRRFVLRRNEDETGISGVGEVAEGVQFTDGTCAMRWRTALASTAVYDSVDDVEAIHGHQGRTLIVWVDEL